MRARKIKVSRRGWFTEDVKLRIEGLPDGVSAQVGPIARGESEVEIKLTASEKAPLDGDIKMTVIGESEVNGRKTAKLTESGDVSIDLETTSGGAKVTGSLSSTDSIGTIHVDPQKGWIISKTGKVAFSGNLTVEAGDQTINIEQSQTHSYTVKLLEKLPD